MPCNYSGCSGYSGCKPLWCSRRLQGLRPTECARYGALAKRLGHYRGLAPPNQPEHWPKASATEGSGSLPTPINIGSFSSVNSSLQASKQHFFAISLSSLSPRYYIQCRSPFCPLSFYLRSVRYSGFATITTPYRCYLIGLWEPTPQ